MADVVRSALDPGHPEPQVGACAGSAADAFVASREDHATRSSAKIVDSVAPVAFEPAAY